MLHCKDTTIFSEISKFFTEKDASKAMQVIADTMRALKLTEKQLFGKKSNYNCKFTQKQVLELLLLFPCFMVKNAYNYTNSSLYNLYEAHKDMFYRLLANEDYDWRKIQTLISNQLWQKTQRRRKTNDKQPVCLIFDDTDFPKRGTHAELLGKVFSHVDMRLQLAFKALFMAITDGTSQMLMDFALVGEDMDKQQGLTKKQLDARYEVERKEDSPVKQRIEEYKRSKIELMKEMISRAIKNHIHFDYVLADSWFACKELIQFITSRHVHCHYLGMIKMGNTKYEYNGEQYTAKQLIAMLNSKNKGRKYSRKLRCYYITADVLYGGRKVRLFFCKRGHHAQWNGLITTDLKLDFLQAYQIYAMRWSIEVSFKEAKQNLGLGKYQMRNFQSQIAATSITMIQYNLLSVAKRFSDYETIGGLFTGIRQEGIELSVVQRIWDAMLELVGMIVEMMSVDENEVLDMLINRSQELNNFIEYYKLKQAA